MVARPARATMSAYVLDNAGEMVHMERMDGQVSSDMHTALLKAQTALRLREPTSIRGTQMLNAGRAPGAIPVPTCLISISLRAASPSLSMDK